MARVSTSAGARISTSTGALPLGLVRASAAPSAGCQLFLASHYINDQKKFKATMDTVTPEMMPSGVTSHGGIPGAGGGDAGCAWAVVAKESHHRSMLPELRGCKWRLSIASALIDARPSL